jgi:hypothetical protein
MNVNLVNRFNLRDTQFRQPWIGRNNWHLRFGGGGNVPNYMRGKPDERIKGWLSEYPARRIPK